MGEKRHGRAPGLSRRDVVRDALVLAAAGLTAPFTGQRGGGGPILEKPVHAGRGLGRSAPQWHRAVDATCARSRGRCALGPVGARLSARLGGAGPRGDRHARGQARHRHRSGEKRLRRPRGGNGLAARTELRLSLHARRRGIRGRHAHGARTGRYAGEPALRVLLLRRVRECVSLRLQVHGQREAKAAVHRPSRRLHLRADLRRVLSARLRPGPQTRAAGATEGAARGMRRDPIAGSQAQAEVRPRRQDQDAVPVSAALRRVQAR